jgi:hypothetical protein
MTSERDIERLLDRWFTERPTQVADRVIDDVAARIVREPQRAAWRLQPWRFPTMSTPIKLVAVGAALLVVILGGAIFIGGGSAPVLPAPSPSPTPSASPSTAASASAVFPQWYTTTDSSGAGILPAGNATTRGFMPGSTVDVPAGWVNDIDTSEFYRLFPDTPANEAEFALSEGPAQNVFMGIVDTPSIGICEGVGDTAGSTAAELVDSLVADEALVTSEPVDVTIGGLTGARVDAHLDPDWTGSCTDTGKPATKGAKDYRGRFIFLDRPSPGRVLIVVDSIHSADFEAFLAEAMPVVESWQFDLTP